MPITKKPLKKPGIKSGIKRKPKAKKTKPRVPLEKKTASQLIGIADKEFSRYIRLRDSEYKNGAWVGVCIDCPKVITVITVNGKWTKSGNNGHYIGRGIHQLRYDEVNCNLQSSYCNAWEDKEKMLSNYAKALDAKYGSGTAKRLRQEGRLDGSRKRLTKAELLQVIHDCRVRVDVMLELGYN